MPSILHDTPFAILTPVFQNFLDELPGSDAHITTSVRTALEICHGRTTFIPDIALCIANPLTAMLAIPVIGETTFLQSRDAIMRKLRNALQAKPGVLMIVLVKIEEDYYQAPQLASNTNHPLNRGLQL